MREDISKASSESDETELIFKTVQQFVVSAKSINTPDMTALVASLISVLVDLLERNTDADTALKVLSKIMMSIAPRGEHVHIQIIHQPSMEKH